MKNVFIFTLIASILLMISYYVIDSYRFVSSTYSKYCYLSTKEVNKNIKNRLYYSTLAECGKPLK